MANFTDRYVILPIEVYNKKQSELTGKEDYVDAELKVLPFEIVCYYRSRGEGGQVNTQIYLKNGEWFIIILPPDEFEKAINKHQSTNH